MFVFLLFDPVLGKWKCNWTASGNTSCVELNSDPQKICPCPKSPPAHWWMWSLWKMVFAYVIKLRLWDMLILANPGILNPMTGVLIWEKQVEIRHREEKAMWRLNQRSKLCKPQTWNQQKLEETRKVSAPEPLEGVWPCCHLDLGLLDSIPWENTFLWFYASKFMAVWTN